jgi:hypothetical protein
MSFWPGTPNLGVSKFPKFPKLELPQLWRPITSYVDIWLKWGLKQSCSSCRELLNDMQHNTFTQVNQGNSRILVVGSQIGNLTSSLSFGHNLCFKYPNGSCGHILNIYIPRAFQLYNELFNHMRFDPLQLPYEGLGVHQQSNSQSGSSFGSVGVHCLTLSYTPGSMKCDSWDLFLARTFASPCFSREPKAKVMTLILLTLIPKVSWRIMCRLIGMLFVLFKILEILYENDSPRMNLFLPSYLVTWHTRNNWLH